MPAVLCATPSVCVCVYLLIGQTDNTNRLADIPTLTEIGLRPVSLGKLRGTYRTVRIAACPRGYQLKVDVKTVSQHKASQLSEFEWM
jgi:hypothetical protein